MKAKAYIPQGSRRLRAGEIIRQGDRFKSQEGFWVRTCDYGRKHVKGYPQHYTKPQYSGIYIRKIIKK